MAVCFTQDDGGRLREWFVCCFFFLEASRVFWLTNQTSCANIGQPGSRTIWHFSLVKCRRETKEENPTKKKFPSCCVALIIRPVA